MTEREAIKMALDLIESEFTTKGENKYSPDEVIEALRQALAKPEQEPAFYIVEMELEALRRDGRRAMVLYTEPITNGIEVPVYTAPPQRTAAEGEDTKAWVGLTKEEIDYLVYSTPYEDDHLLIEKTESLLKEKNT